MRLMYTPTVAYGWVGHIAASYIDRTRASNNRSDHTVKFVGSSSESLRFVVQVQMQSELVCLINTAALAELLCFLWLTSSLA
jgi:hypothetical protein